MPIARMQSALHKHLTPGLLLGYVLTGCKWGAVLALGIATWAQLRDKDVTECIQCFKDWQLWAFVAVGLFAGADPGKRLRQREFNKKVADARSNYLVQGWTEIREITRLRKNHAVSVRSAQECLLKAAAYELRLMLGIHDPEAIRVNLIAALPPKQFRVVARSRPGSALVSYDMSPGSAATQAMEANRAVVVCNAGSLNPGHRRSYRCVVAVPICDGKCAYGAVCADSDNSKEFKGKESLIDQILRPYAAAMLITLGPTPPSFLCPEKHE